MPGPVDGATLTMSERQGIEIDYRPRCRGVRLARGEPDKIIERSAAPGPPRDPPPQAWGSPGYAPKQYGQQGPSYGHGQPHHHKRKTSFLEELFD